MTKTRLFLSLFLVTVLLAGCAPATPTVAPAQPEVTKPSATPASIQSPETTPTVDLTATYTLELLSATPPVEAQPVATSRGPDLHATDPATVKLASGKLHFVEFFRFT